MHDLYVYAAELVQVVDGDTYDFHVDTGFYGRYSNRFRLNGYDTPELRRGTDFEKAKASEATAFAQRWFGAASGRIFLRTHKADSFGRWLADVETDVEMVLDQSLGKALRDEGLASEWPTRWRDEFDA